VLAVLGFFLQKQAENRIIKMKKPTNNGLPPGFLDIEAV